MGYRYEKRNDSDIEDGKDMAEEVAARELADWLLAHGRTHVTTREAAELLDVPPHQVRVRLHAQVLAKRLFSPARGLWVPIPPEFRTWGVAPALHFIDDLMEHLGRDYYVGWLSAAELYGAAHQRPQVFQAAVDKRVESRAIERVRLQFVVRSRLLELPRVRRTTPTGEVWVATPELVAFDLAADAELGAGLSNTATVLADLGQEPGLDADALTTVAAHFPAAAVARLGYLLELTDAPVDTSRLQAHLLAAAGEPARLAAGGPRWGPRSERWNLIVNTEVEPDL